MIDKHFGNGWLIILTGWENWGEGLKIFLDQGGRGVGVVLFPDVRVAAWSGLGSVPVFLHVIVVLGYVVVLGLSFLSFMCSHWISHQLLFLLAHLCGVCCIPLGRDSGFPLLFHRIDNSGFVFIFVFIISFTLYHFCPCLKYDWCLISGHMFHIWWTNSWFPAHFVV